MKLTKDGGLDKRSKEFKQLQSNGLGFLAGGSNRGSAKKSSNNGDSKSGCTGCLFGLFRLLLGRK